MKRTSLSRRKTPLRRKTPFRSRARRTEQWRPDPALAMYRIEQAQHVVERDGGLCQLCLLHHGEDVHHVFGRGREVSSWREHHTCLMLVCRDCHPSPLYAHDPARSVHPIAERMREVNEREAGL